MISNVNCYAEDMICNPHEFVEEAGLCSIVNAMQTSCYAPVRMISNLCTALV